MNQIYKYQENTDWTFSMMFTYETDTIQKKMSLVNAKDCLPSPEMERYIPIIDDLFFQCTQNSKIRQRIVFYSVDNTYEDKDLQLIMNFKVWCLMNGKLLPDGDEEILRGLYARDFDNQKAYDSIQAKL